MNKLLKLICLTVTLFMIPQLKAQETDKPEPSINLQYFNLNGKVQYLKVKAMVKENDKLKPLNAAPLKLYLNEADDENMFGQVITDEKGEAKAVIPPAFKEKWNATTTHKFIASYGGSKQYTAATGEAEIGKLKIDIDTVNDEGVRNVVATLYAFDSTWVPVKDVDVKIGVRRLGGDLKIGEEETYTSDSVGKVQAEFKLDKLPAIDKKNNLVLVVKTEENETYGNVSFEKIVPWGLYTPSVNNFDKRSLWATRDKAPLWLIFMASSIGFGVWGVIIYLLFQVRRLVKLGREPAKEKAPGSIMVEALEV